ALQQSGVGALAIAGLLKSLADDLGLGFDPLACDMGEAWQGARPACLEERGGEPWRTLGDTRERLELLAFHWIERCRGGDSPPRQRSIQCNASNSRRSRASPRVPQRSPPR
ncbi:hypothetical protein QM333_35215, partial [Pseudomonas aeruginosa]|uniref:hypothetical protein n=1 Tax=Pseudomonas aeruginosa TaxID=287 RepID=UPI0024B6B092